MMDGGITKMKIEFYAKSDDESSLIKEMTFKVMFNPHTYSLKHEVEYEDKQGKGDSSSALKFSKIKPKDYNFEFVFDGTGVTGEVINVQKTIDDFIKAAGKQNPDTHRPNFLKVSWGELIINRCVLKSAEVNYTLFSPDAKPLRAKMKVAFSENIDDKKRVAEDRRNSPDLTHKRIVSYGDTLPLMTAKIYGDSSYYLQIASFNQLRHFRRLEVGQVIFFPPLKDQIDERR